MVWILGFAAGLVYKDWKCPNAGYLQITPEENTDQIHIHIDSEKLIGHDYIQLTVITSQNKQRL
jgi:hypothetical protein